MVSRNHSRKSPNRRSRPLHDSPKPRKTARRKTAFREAKDQEVPPKGAVVMIHKGKPTWMIPTKEQPPIPTVQVTIDDGPSELNLTRAFTGKNPPWVLERAKNWVSGLRNADKVGINPKDQLGAAKVPMHLVPPASIILQALCMDDGNIKYGPYNVRMEPIQAIGYIAAAMRHLQAYLDGQDYDPLTGKPHLGYGLATIGLVIDAWLNGTLIDNRPVPGIGGQLLDALAMKPGEEARSPDEYRKIFEQVEAFGKKQSQERFDASVAP